MAVRGSEPFSPTASFPSACGERTPSPPPGPAHRPPGFLRPETGRSIRHFLPVLDDRAPQRRAPPWPEHCTPPKKHSPCAADPALPDAQARGTGKSLHLLSQYRHPVPGYPPPGSTAAGAAEGAGRRHNIDEGFPGKHGTALLRRGWSALRNIREARDGSRHNEKAQRFLF